MIINSTLWAIYHLAAMTFKRPTPWLLSLFIFSLSHCFGIFFLASNLFHNILFNDHWSFFSLMNAFNGILAGQAPLGFAWSQILLLECLIFFSAILIVFATKYTIKVLCVFPIHFTVPHFLTYLNNPLLFFSIALLIVLSSPFWLKDTLGTRLISEGIPIFNLIQKKSDYNIQQLGLSALTNSEPTKIAFIKALEQYDCCSTLNVIAKNTPDILMIHIESFRGDLLTEKNAPNIYRFSRNHTVLNNHYSSSNNTPTAMFSLLTGLSGSYYQYFRMHPHTPIPLQILKHIGYQFHIYHSDSLAYENIGEYLLPDFKRTRGKGANYEEKDASSIHHFALDLTKNSNTKTPRFDYLTIDSSHFPYYYPSADFENFSPTIPLGYKISSASFNHMESKKVELKNRFLNSIYYADHLVGDLLEHLKRQNQLNNRIIVIFGDHGEEFWEHQRFGHSYGMVNEQIKVSTIMSFPEPLRSDYNYSGHQDIMPTILNYMSLNIPTHEFSNGKNLFSFEKNKDFTDVAMGVISKVKRYEYAVIGQGLKIVYKLKNQLEIKSITTDLDQPVKHWDGSTVSSLIKANENHTKMNKQINMNDNPDRP